MSFYLLFISESGERSSRGLWDRAGQEEVGASFVQDIKGQSIALWAQWRVLQAISRGSLLGANLHVYFPGTRLEQMNGLAMSLILPAQSCLFPAVTPVHNQPSFSKSGSLASELYLCYMHQFISRIKEGGGSHLRADLSPLNLAQFGEICS